MVRRSKKKKKKTIIWYVDYQTCQVTCVQNYAIKLSLSISIWMTGVEVVAPGEWRSHVHLSPRGCGPQNTLHVTRKISSLIQMRVQILAISHWHTRFPLQ